MPDTPEPRPAFEPITAAELDDVEGGGTEELFGAYSYVPTEYVPSVC